MPQDPLFHDDSNRPLYGVRITVEDHSQVLDTSTGIRVEVKPLDGDWTSLCTCLLVGRGRDFLASAVEDIVHAWQYEDRRAIVLMAQQNQRLAAKHERTYSRSGS